MNVRILRSLLLDPASGPSAPQSIPPSGGAGGSVAPQSSVAPVAGRTDSAPSSIPPGQRLVSEQEWARAEALNKRWSELGVGDNEYDGYKSLIQAVKGRKEDPSHLANFLAGKKEQAKEEGRSSDFDPEKFKAETLAEWRREQAMKEHDSKWSDVRDKTIKAKIAELLDGKDDDVLSPLLYKAALHDIMEARYKTPRDEKDPLHGLRGLDVNDEMLKSILTPYGDVAKKLRGQKMQAVADAANRGRSGTPGGNSGGNAGGPKADGPRPISREATRELVESKMAKAGIRV